MLIDLTVPVSPQTVQDAQGNEKKANFGHLGTHFDVMNKEFPLDYLERPGMVFDVSGVQGRDIGLADIAVEKVQKGMFAAFHTGFIQREGYGTKRYFSEHPQLSNALVDALLDRGAAIIGIDCAGIRRGAEHTPKDQYCADRGAFVVENLCNLQALLQKSAGHAFTINTYPVRFADMTGLPCRVVAKVPGE